MTEESINEQPAWLEKLREALEDGWWSGPRSACDYLDIEQATGIFKNHGIQPWLSHRDLLLVLDEPLQEELRWLDPLLAIRELVYLPERSHLRPYPIEVVWRTGKWTSQGRTVLGKAGPVPSRERQTWTGAGKAPLFRVQLSLPYWLLADEMQRLRLIHHELGHCGVNVSDDGEVTPTGIGHDIEEFVSTAARFGSIASPALLQLAEATRVHPTTPPLMEEWKTVEQLSLLDWEPYTPMTETQRVHLQPSAVGGVYQGLMKEFGLEGMTISSGGRSVTITATVLPPTDA